MNMKHALLIASAASVAACASGAPERVIEPVAPPPPPPPAPVAPVAQDPAFAPGSVRDFRETAGERIFYDFDSFALTGPARDILERQAAWLQSYPATKVLIAGNCDERGTREYNLALGARRANAVKDFLIAQGVDASRITTISYGKERPLDPASNERAWALNRNAHTQIVSGAIGGGV